MSETTGAEIHLGEYSISVHNFCPTCYVLGTEAIINLGFFGNGIVKLIWLWTSCQQYISGWNYLEAITLFCLGCDLRMFAGIKNVERITIGYWNWPSDQLCSICQYEVYLWPTFRRTPSGKIHSRAEQTAFHEEILRTSDFCAQGPDFSLACRASFSWFLAVFQGSLE